MNLFSFFTGQINDIYTRGNIQNVTWVHKINTCKQDLSSLLHIKNQNLEKYINEENDNKVVVLLNEIQIINTLLKECNSFNTGGSTPSLAILSSKDIEIISDIEKSVYNLIMTDSVRKELIRRIEESERLVREENDMYDEIERLWDHNVSEEDIKHYIKEDIKRRFPSYTEQQLTIRTDESFIIITMNKNVRIALNETQISNLLKI